MPYLRGSLAKECLATLSTSEKCSGIRCYVKRVGQQYLKEDAKTVGVSIGTVAGSAAVTTAVGVVGAIVGSAGKCFINPPKTYVGVSLRVAGTLLSTCAVIPTPAAPYCATASAIAFYGGSRL